jgi:hypothetical protein
MKVSVKTVDTGTGMLYEIVDDVPEFSADAISLMLARRLAADAECDDADSGYMQPDTVVFWHEAPCSEWEIKSGKMREAAFVFSADEPCLGPILVSGIAYTVDN